MGLSLRGGSDPPGLKGRCGSHSERRYLLIVASSTPCPYCGEPLNARPTHAEHALPRALGGALEVDAHLDCGDLLNRTVDEPLVQCIPVVKVRADYGIPDRYGKRPHPPAFTGIDAAGARSTLRLLPYARVDIHHRPHEQVEEDDSITVRFDPDENEDVIERKIAAARRRSPNVRAVTQRGSRKGGYRVGGFKTPLYGWPKLAAKVGLAVGSLVAEAEWLEGETAGHLREVLWASPKEKTHLALNMAPGDPPENSAVRGALLPPEHLIWTSHSPAGLASVCIYLFAEWFLPVPLALTPEEGRLVRDYAWLIEPRLAKVIRKGPLDEVSRDLERRRPRVETAVRAQAQLIKRIEREANELRTRSASL